MVSSNTFTGSASVATSTQPYAERARVAREARGVATLVNMERRRENEAAEENALTLRARLRSGDASVSAADLLTADAEVERASLLAAAAERALTVAQRSVLSEDTTLAETLSSVVSGLYGLPSVACNEVPLKDDEDTYPALYLVQTEDAQILPSGGVRGNASLAIRRGAFHRVLSAEEVERACEKQRGWRVEAHSVGTTEEEDGTYLDEIALTVTQAYPAIPLLPSTPGGEVALRSVEAFVPSGAGIVSAFTHYKVNSRGEYVEARTRADGAPRVGAEDASLVQDVTDAEGIRRRTFTVTAYVLTTDSRWTPAEAGETLAAVAGESLTGSVIGGVGRIESARVEGLRPTTRDGAGGVHDSGREATIRLTCVSTSQR